MFTINDDTYATIPRCARLLGVTVKAINAVLRATEIASLWVEGLPPRYVCVEDVQAALVPPEPASQPIQPEPAASAVIAAAPRANKPKRSKKWGGVKVEPIINESTRTFVSAETIDVLYPGCPLSDLPSRIELDGITRYDPVRAMEISPRPERIEPKEIEETEE